MIFVCILIAAMTLLFVLAAINHTEASPNITLANRWLRWGVFAAGAGWLANLVLTQHPLWTLTLIFALIWFLGETFYTWIAIQAYSHSELPLFPRYEPNTSGEEWSTQRRFLRMRDEIRAAGFKHRCSMRAHLIENIHMRASVYEDAAATTRLQVTFVPRPGGNVAAIASFATLTFGGNRYVTDNTFMPYAGFYPENWLVERKPRTRSLAALLGHHRRRLARSNEIPKPGAPDPLEEINANQRTVEQLNIEMGFLTPRHQREEHGRITKAGLYRTWKELWTLNYLGMSMKYW